MVWINVKRKNLIGLECVNPITNKYILRLSPNSKNIPIENLNILKDDTIADKYKYDTRILSITVNNEPSIDDIKNILLYLQQEYYNSNEIKTLIINNNNVWLDSSTRLKVLNRLNVEKDSNTENTTIWFDDKFIKLKVDKAIKFISMIEKYAKQCYDNTQKHYAEIKKLDSIEACLEYDITSDYPDILNITLTD